VPAAGHDSGIKDWTGQQPGGDTPGVAAAPVALAGAIVPGVARFIVMLSAHADVFGVGITAIVGSMLVPPSCVISGWMVPDGGFAAISGVESGKAAPLVGGPPGTELHTVVEGLPSAFVGEMLPVVVATIGVGMVPSGAPGVIAVADIVVVDGVGAGGAVVTSEGGAQVTTPRTRYLTTGIAVMLAASQVSPDRDAGRDVSAGEAGRGAANGASGFRFVGMIVGFAARSRAVSLGFGSYGAGMSVYYHFLARGRDVVYPKDMAMVIGLGTREGGKAAPGF